VAEEGIGDWHIYAYDPTYAYRISGDRNIVIHVRKRDLGKDRFFEWFRSEPLHRVDPNWTGSFIIRLRKDDERRSEM
jgi:hypothetical protein